MSGFVFAMQLLLAAWSPLASPEPAPICLEPPVVAPVAVSFRAPGCPYCPGQRGIEYAVPVAEPVHAVAAGSVTFSGVVVGTRYLVILHTGGVLATYGMLSDAAVRTGDVVRSGQVVAHASTRLYFGIRIAGEYRDPIPFFGRIGIRPRLVPTDGSGRRPGRPRPSSCEFVAATSRQGR